MNRATLRDERGSLPLTLLAVLIVSGLLTVMLGQVVTGQRLTGFDQRFEQSLQVADAGLERAVYLVESRTKTDDFAYSDSGTGYTVNADRLSSGDWVLTAQGTVNGTTRRLRAEINVESLFTRAAFGKFFADFNGGNGADSYRSAANVVPLLCQGSPGGTPVTDPSASNQADVYICTAAQTNAGTIATNGELFLKGETASNVTGRIEVHNATAPNVADPLPDATGYCRGVPATCSSPKLDYYRDPIVLEPVESECASYTSAFPNASTPRDVAGRYLLAPGVHCFTSVTLGSTTVVQGTAANPTKVYLSGTLAIPNGQVVNFELDAAGIILPRPRPSPSLRIFSTGTGPSLQFGNHASLSAAVYAPNAGFAGGAKGNIYGSLIAGSINNNGGWHFHYDQSLADVTDNTTLRATSWSEE